MGIVIIGGHEGMVNDYKSIAKTLGYKAKIYPKMPPKLNKVIGSTDGIVVFTSTASHKMTMTAVSEAKRKNIPIVRCHNSSKVSLKESIKQLEECWGDCESCPYSNTKK